MTCSEISGTRSPVARSNTLQVKRQTDARAAEDAIDPVTALDGAQAQPNANPGDPRQPDRDEVKSTQEVSEDAHRSSHPLDGLTDDELESILLNTPEKLGSIALGPPNAGALMNGVNMPEGERWQIVKVSQAWGTQETVDSIQRVINVVHEQHPDTQPLYIGDISRKRGGYFYPHTNHQNGRDADIGFYYKAPTRWYTRAWRSNLDVPRTWALLKAFVTKTDVELIYCDRFVIALVRDHAQKIGEDSEWLEDVFRRSSAAHVRPLIRHEEGHRTHLHVRFYTPTSEETGRRVFHLLERHELLRHPVVFAHHKVKAGETLRSVAKLYKSSRRAIRQFNQLDDDPLKVGRTYAVPYQGKLERQTEQTIVPPRLIPKASKAGL